MTASSTEIGLATFSAGLGADHVLVNPLHAASPVPPIAPSPYLPVTKRFANPLYLRIEAIPEYDYLDVFFSSALGTLAVPGTAITLSGGQSATVTGTLTAAAPAAAGRQLFGEMTVVTPAGAVLGTGSVLVSAP